MKSKRMSLYIVSVILLVIMILGSLGVATWALLSTKLDVSGNIGFQGTGDVLAIISDGKVDGTKPDGKMNGFEIKADSETPADARGTWTNLNDLAFAGDSKTLVISFSVTNKHTEKNLEIKVGAFTATENNITISVTTTEYGVANPVIIAPQAEANYSITFTAVDINKKIERGFELVYNLVNTDAATSVDPSDPTSKLNFELIDNDTAYTVKALNTSISGEVVIPSEYNGLPVKAINSTYGPEIRGAFDGCSGLTSIIIPSSVTSIGPQAFFDCSGLTTIEIPSSISIIEESTFAGCASLVSVTIPESVTEIGMGAFAGCTSLTSIDLPSNLTSIGDTAFYESGLTTVNIPASVELLGYSIFGGCVNLASITVDAENSSYSSSGNCLIEGSTVIAGCKNSEIPSDGSITMIGDSAFEGCRGLTSISIPECVTSIGSYAFSGCSGLTSISIPECVTSIGSYAFSGCSGLTSISIPDNITSIGDNAFTDCPDRIFTLYDNGKYLGGPSNRHLALIEAKNTMITSIVVNANTKIIVGGAFSQCDQLSTINIPASVEEIGSCTFEGCTGLTEIVFEKTSGDLFIVDGAFDMMEVNVTFKANWIGMEYGNEYATGTSKIDVSELNGECWTIG